MHTATGHDKHVRALADRQPRAIFAAMRTTSSYEIFPKQPDQRDLSRARWLAREGRTDEALAAYRNITEAEPAATIAWAEGFEVLRSAGRREEALSWAEASVQKLGPRAVTLALKGAALIELRRYRDALVVLEQAINYDPDLALVWHELGYAAYKLGEPTRALAALDRAFALEPHTETLLLRGRILLEAGRYTAAEVAFEAASQTAVHDEQRREAEGLIQTARRYRLYQESKPPELPVGQRFFADTGAVVLAGPEGTADDAALLEGLVTLVAERGWEFGQLVIFGDPAPFGSLASSLGLRAEAMDAVDPSRVPLVAASTVGREDPQWRSAARCVRGAEAGMLFVLEHPPATVAEADVIGRIRGAAGRVDPAGAAIQAQHPDARVAPRRLTNRPAPRERRS